MRCLNSAEGYQLRHGTVSTLMRQLVLKLMYQPYVLSRSALFLVLRTMSAPSMSHLKALDCPWIAPV